MELRTIDLRAAAIAEAARLAAARMVARGGDENAREWLAGRRPWIARSRSGRRRQALDGGLLLIWRVAAEDSSGNSFMASNVAMLVDVDAGAWRRSRRRNVEVAMQIGTWPPPPIAAILAEKTARAVAAARAFASARVARDRAVAARWSGSPAEDRFQPGLFDRRAERARRIARAAEIDDDDAANRRLAVAAAAADVAHARPALLLVLTA